MGPALSDAELLQQGQQVLAAQGISRLLGSQLTALTLDGHCTLELPVAEHLMQQHGFVHGGVLSYMADTALTYAGGAAMQQPVLTAEFKINYLRPAVGQLLIARARCVQHGRRQAVSVCEVFAVQNGVEKLCAVAQGTIASLPATKS